MATAVPAGDDGEVASFEACRVAAVEIAPVVKLERAASIVEDVDGIEIGFGDAEV